MLNEFSFEAARVSSPFGPRKAPTAGASTMHKGEDHAVPLGTPITAKHAWKVLSYLTQTKAGRVVGWGRYVVLSSPEYPGYRVRLAHLTSLAPDVRVGDTVPPGQAIAISGNSGTSSGGHVHLELLVGAAAVNPELAPWRRAAAAIMRSRPVTPPSLPPKPASRPVSGPSSRPWQTPRGAVPHAVQRGDTLWKLASRAGASTNAARVAWIESVLELNPGMQPNRLRVGQVVQLPNNV